MYLLVSLKTEKKEKKIIPIKWIKGLDFIKLLNYGVDLFKNKTFIVFYTQHMDEEPDFNSNISEKFNEKRRACYHATIVRGFGMYF